MGRPRIHRRSAVTQRPTTTRPPDLTAKVNQENAKIKPEVRRTTVTKIQEKDIAADEFAVPAEYKRPQAAHEMKSGVPGGPNPPIPAPEQPIPPTPTAASSPAAH